MRLQSRRLPSAIAALSMYVFSAGLAGAAAPSVDAAVEPSQIEMGESARLTIQTSGSGTLSIPLPVVAGLEFRVVGQSRQIQIINGTTFESTSTIVRVTPETPGVFTIPGLTPKSPPLVLRVDPSKGTGSSSANPSASAGLTSLPGQTSANGIRLTPDGSAFVRLDIPKQEIYVGESVPVEIEVGMRDGFVASINGLPKLNSGDFTLNNLSHQPQRVPKMIDGKAFTVLTWRSLLAAVKPGTYSLTFETPLTVRIRTRPQRESMLDDLLGDPFLQNVFGTTVPKDINVTSPETSFRVLPLPAEGKPPGFDGAVGSFKISTDISSATNTAGDPLTLRMRVNGSGSFDRVESRMLGADSVWKTYQPKATFSTADPVGYKGEKIFEQPLIAAQPGKHTVPALSFSFFDPAARRYETVHSSPLSVVVSPAAADRTASEPTPLANAGLRPDHTVTDARAVSLVPLYFQPRFLAIPSALAILFGGAWLALRRRERNAADLQRQRQRERSQRIHTLLEQMKAAAACGDPAMFFNSARSALQEALSARWQVAAEQITVDDIEGRLESADRDAIRQIFALSDEANYSGHALRAADFERWTELVRRHAASDTGP